MCLIGKETVKLTSVTLFGGSFVRLAKNHLHFPRVLDISYFSG